MVKVSVNKETCIACGVCWALVPDVFELDPNTGKTRIRTPYVTNDNDKVSEGNIPSELVDAVKNAANSCPTGSIIVE
ncbi:MAG: ferredoxin [Desulfurococcaceae archaeon]|jgi:ferredoxin|nr:ferredoxin [Desulfurococcaceae archaeon]